MLRKIVPALSLLVFYVVNSEFYTLSDVVGQSLSPLPGEFMAEDKYRCALKCENYVLCRSFYHEDDNGKCELYASAVAPTAVRPVFVRVSSSMPIPNDQTSNKRETSSICSNNRSKR